MKKKLLTMHELDGYMLHAIIEHLKEMSEDFHLKTSGKDLEIWEGLEDA